MADGFDAAVTYHSANKQTDQVNSRGAADVDDNAAADLLPSNTILSKINQADLATSADETNLVEEEKIGGAFYLPCKKDVPSTWNAVLEALQSLEDCDINVEERKNFNAYGLQYYHDTFMLARTRLCKLEGEEGNFLEIHRLEGDGFVFSDQFKKNLTEKIGEFVEDVETVEPIPSENAKDSFLNYLDLSDDSIATDMIQHWLATLKPKAGVKYDQRQIYETLSCLGWNSNEEANFKALQDYSHHIVGPVMEILRHPETNFVPTAYFGAMCINNFVQQQAVPDEIKTWKSVFMLVEAMEKFCLTEAPAMEKSVGDLQVTRSREVLRLLVSILEKFAPTVTGEQPAAMSQKVDQVLAALENTLTKEMIENLRSTLKQVEEEVEAA